MLDAECRVFIVMLSVAVLNAVVLSVVAATIELEQLFSYFEPVAANSGKQMALPTAPLLSLPIVAFQIVFFLAQISWCKLVRLINKGFKLP
jgi:hypothetical protein